MCFAAITALSQAASLRQLHSDEKLAATLDSPLLAA